LLDLVEDQNKAATAAFKARIDGVRIAYGAARIDAWNVRNIPNAKLEV